MDWLAAMLKHSGETFGHSYMMEQFPIMTGVMSGNKPHGTSVMEHAEEESGCTFEECIWWLLPHFVQWQMERESENGDKHKSASNFLYDLIPFLTYVAVQDVPYWLKHFPQHEYSLYIGSKLPPEFMNAKSQHMIGQKKLKMPRQ